MAAPAGNATVATPKFAYPPVSFQNLAWSNPQLESYMKPYVEGFAVVDEPSRQALSEMTSDRGLGWDQFLYTFFKRSFGHSDVALLKNLVGLGMNLSQAQLHGELAQRNEATFSLLWPLLLRTRVDIDLQFCAPADHSGREWVETTLRKLSVDKFSKSGRVQQQSAPGSFTSVAQLACEGDFYAVFSLIRRDVVSFSELHEKYNGKNVLEWARFYCQDLLDKELVFRYPFLARESAPKLLVADGKDPKDAMMERLQQKVDALTKENETLKQELAQMKEYVGLCVEKVDKDVSGLEKKVEAKSKELKSDLNEKVQRVEDIEETLKEYLTRRGFKYYRDLIVKMRDRFNLSDDSGEEHQ